MNRSSTRKRVPSPYPAIVPLLSLLALFLSALSPAAAQTHSAREPRMSEEERRHELTLNAFVVGAAFEAEENYARAWNMYERALELTDDPAIHAAAGRMAQETGNSVSAVHHFVSALAKRPDDVWLLRRLGDIYAQRRQADSAALMLEGIRRIEGEDETLLQALGSMYAAQRKFDNAAEIYDTLRLRFPERPMYALMLAEMEMNRGRWNVASELMLPLSADTSIGHEDRIQIGKLYFQKALQQRNDIDRALTVFTNLQRDFPDDWRPYWFRGAVRFSAGATAEAMIDFEQVMRLSPENTEAGMILARAYIAQARPADAVRVLQQLVDRGVAGKETWALLGHAWSTLGKNDRAVEALEQARRQDPGDAEVLATLAVNYADLGVYDSSDALYNEVIRLHDERGLEKDNRYYLLLNNYAWTLAERGRDLERALSMSEQAVGHAPTNSAYCDTRGWILHLLGRQDEALDWLRKALQLREASSGNPAVLHEHLGAVYVALGRPAEARAHWEEALRRAPGNTRLREQLERLK
ncbi:MAG: tetratricopeptide repeat protein [Bacteroidetes bacterium]|nr:tetratricopeptide repeat protein [Bacteroidota bacterium]